jgi:hypothetical protein
MLEGRDRGIFNEGEQAGFHSKISLLIIGFVGWYLNRLRGIAIRPFAGIAPTDIVRRFAAIGSHVVTASCTACMSKVCQ